MAPLSKPVLGEDDVGDLGCFGVAGTITYEDRQCSRLFGGTDRGLLTGPTSGAGA
jgi:hypothetical protein